MNEHPMRDELNDNPWHTLREGPPYVLREDENAVRHFNSQNREIYRLRVDDILPEPFVGDPNAPVVVLGNNPGFNPTETFHKLESRFVARLRDNLEHKPSDFPFVFYAPDIHESLKKWWNKKLKGLLHFGYDVLAQSIFAVEYFPYPSMKFLSGGLELPSRAQAYNFALVNKAIDRGAVIVLTRGEKWWLQAVPRLDACVCRVRNKMAGSISRRNCDEFDRVVRAIETYCVQALKGRPA